MNPMDSNAGGTTVVIFGASGDLTRRKLIPAFYNNFRKKRLPAGLRIVGFARRDWSDDQFKDRLGTGVKDYGTGFDPRVWNDFARTIHYFQGDLDASKDYDSSKKKFQNERDNLLDKFNKGELKMNALIRLHHDIEKREQQFDKDVRR